MAVSSKRVLTSGVINTTYINVLQRLCTSTKATTQDISEIFKKLSRSLRSQTSTRSTSPSSHDPTSRRGDSEAATMLQGGKGDRESFDRRCTWDPGEKQCWLVSDLEPWNRVLFRSCIELWEHSWGELTLAGFHWLDSNPPKIVDVLQASLLMHLLLRQHRCVTRVLMNQSITCVEMDMFWHSLQNGGAGVLSFEFVALRSSGFAAPQCFDVRVWSQSTVCLPALHSLHVSYALFDADVAHTLGDYLMRTTTLRSIALSNVQTDSEAASVFLDNLADNKTVTNILLQKHFVMAREGDALAGVLRRHIALECLKIIGPGDHSPSAVLRAAVLSSSLKSLTVSCFNISAEDIDAMATALTRLPPSYASFTGAVAQPPLTQTSRLESLAFSGCPTAEPHLQRAYARLIGGVLRRLQISQCTLGHVFAIAAACQLRKDSRLHVLNVQFSQLPSLSICTLVRALKVNSTLQRMVFNLHGFLPELDLFTLFHTIREMDVSSRILFSWYEPRPLHVAQGGRLGTISTFAVDLDKLSAEEASTLLEPLTPGGHVTSAKIKSASPVEDAVVQQLADAFGKTKSVRHLILELNWPETSIVNLLRTLEQNRSVCVLKIIHVIFTKRTSKALARVVEENRALNKIFVDLVEGAYDGSSQLRTLCRELKVAVPRNRFLTTVAVKFGGINCASDFVIKHALRRNRMLANQAVNFVKGSNDKKDALAFETLQHSWAVRSDLKAVGGEVSNDAPARKKINEARRRLAFNYFIFTGVVKTKIICYGRRRGKTSFDKLGRDVLVHVCSYLSLTDVMDI